MSDASHQEERHEGPIKTPKQLIAAVVASFVVPIVVIVLLANYVTQGNKPAAGSDAMTPEAIAKRVAPIAKVEWKDASAARTLKTGEEVYKAQCAVCHAAGVAGAPKLGDAAAWAARIKTGYEALLNSALKGKGAMAAQGGGDYDDVEIGRAVVYMANGAGGKFAEPQAPAAPKAAVADATAAAAPAAAMPAAAPMPAPAAAPAAVAVAAAAAPAAAKVNAGEALYKQACSACHAAGVAGAPKAGDKAAWAPRIATGIDAMTASVIKGKGAMPPRGAAGNASDADIKAAVEYLAALAK
jgi:cytochrome c5